MANIPTFLGLSTTDVGIPQVPLTNATLGDILSTVFLIVGGLAVLFVLVGAVRYVTSGGDANRTKQARDTILYSLIGLVVSLSAFTIVQFMLGRLSGTL